MRTSDQASDNSGFWRKLWNLKIPAKVEHFLWSASIGSLPTKDHLRERRVMVDTLCPTCNEAPETTFHSLITCSFAMEYWYKLGKLVNAGDSDSFSGWLSSAFYQYNGKDIQKIVMLCWALWKNRNNIVWNQRGMEVADVVILVQSTLSQWLSAQDKHFDMSLDYMTQVDGTEHWKIPDVNTIKINVDAAIFEASQRFSYAMVARNSDGGLIKAFSKCRQGSLNPEVAEAIGVREALSWTKKKQWCNVVLETDCLILVQAVRSKTTLFSYFGRVVEECKYALECLKDKNVSLRFVKRSENNLAHYLARHSSFIAERTWGADNAHSEFIRVMLEDLKY